MRRASSPCSECFRGSARVAAYQARRGVAPRVEVWGRWVEEVGVGLLFVRHRFGNLVWHASLTACQHKAVLPNCCCPLIHPRH
eukprot:365865-Chlamydomonas_euryale.AAC.20